MLVQASDAISAARPGARRESLENYIKRLESLEEIANSFDGSKNLLRYSWARSAHNGQTRSHIGRSKIVTARDIAIRIEEELEYPGQIKINVIRETRAMEYTQIILFNFLILYIRKLRFFGKLKNLFLCLLVRFFVIFNVFKELLVKSCWLRMKYRNRLLEAASC